MALKATRGPSREYINQRHTGCVIDGEVMRVDRFDTETIGFLSNQYGITLPPPDHTLTTEDDFLGHFSELADECVEAANDYEGERNNPVYWAVVDQCLVLYPYCSDSECGGTLEDGQGSYDDAGHWFCEECRPAPADRFTY